MSGDRTFTLVTQETTCTVSTTRHCLEVGKMLFNYAHMHQCSSIYCYTETGHGNLHVPFLLWQRNTSLCFYLPMLLAVTLTVVFMLVYQVAYKFSLDFPVVAYDSHQIKYFYPSFIKRNGFTKLLPLLRSSSQTLRRTSDFDSRLILGAGWGETTKQCVNIVGFASRLHHTLAM